MGVGQTVEKQWARLRADPFLERVRELIDAAHQSPWLRLLYPYTEHLDLHFSRNGNVPYDDDLPYIQPLADGRYRVCALDAGVTAVVVAEQEAIGLAIAALPADVRDIPD